MIHLDSDYDTIDDKKDDGTWPGPYVSTIGLTPYINRLKGDSLKMLEIGTGMGEGLYHVLDKCPRVKTAITVDPYKQYTDWNGILRAGHLEKTRDIATMNLSVFNDRVKQYSQIPWDLVNNLDILYIDADNSYGTTYDLLMKLSSQVRPDGIIAVHNARMEPVNLAIKACRKEMKNTNPLHTLTNSVWFWNAK